MDRLVSNLSLDERLNLLDKFKGQSDISADPLYHEVKADVTDSSGTAAFVTLPWYYRLYYFVLSFFRGSPPAKLYEEGQVGDLGRRINELAPDLYDYQKNVLLSEFCVLLTDLKEAARFFYSALDVSVNQDKGGFYAFLGSLEMNDVHRRLHTGTDPETIAQQMPDAEGPEIKQHAYKVMEEAFSSVTAEQRNTMYLNARSMTCFKELSSFLFDRVIMAFGIGHSGHHCPANVIKDLLLTLNNILFSLKEPPTLSLLESLFVFQMQEKAGDPHYDMKLEMRKLLNKAEKALAYIRNFNKKVPLTLILRCIYRDFSLSPEQISGGEEWFAVYRDHWKRHIESKLSDYLQIRKQKEMTDTFRFFLKGTNLRMLENVVVDSTPEGLPVPDAFTLAFLRTFHSAVFLADINPLLRSIIIDGQFFKRENRTEFTECYNDLMKLEDDIRSFEVAISPEGELGKRFISAKQDISSLPIKRRKAQLVQEDASRIALGIIDRSRQAMDGMINILSGILKKEAGGKYDTLANLAQFTGKTTEFVDSANDSILKFNTALQLLDDIIVINSSQH